VNENRILNRPTLAVVIELKQGLVVQINWILF